MTRFRFLRPASPFTGATRSDLALLRALATGVKSWEAAAAAGQYYPLPYAHQILGNGGGLHQAHVLSEFESRAWDRLAARPDYDNIAEAHRVARMRRFDPQAYEVHLLRRELAAHEAACTCARG